MAGIKEFMEKMESDAAFWENIQSAADKDELMSKIKAAGLDVTFEEYIEAVGGKCGELSDEELESAAGGTYGNRFVSSKDLARMGEIRKELMRTDLTEEERIMLKEELRTLQTKIYGNPLPF